MPLKTLRLTRIQKDTVPALLNVQMVERLRRAARSVPSRARPAQELDRGRHDYHVYVALLRGVPGDPDEFSLYVGSTGLPPEARYMEHLLGHKAGKRRISRYGVGLLPQLTRRLNPMGSSRDAEAVEEELRLAFRREGFAAHGSKASVV